MSTTLSKRGRLNALRRYRNDDDPDVLAAAADLRAARAEDYVRQLVEDAPPLTQAQRRRLAAILCGDMAGAA